ncbi:MAG: HAMP domain-containing protein, partial [Candidatus Omnitrophica bacterium]|nr:HAMP domain-containing protein [Candidatus Omnitrophota bacterium]
LQSVNKTLLPKIALLAVLIFIGGIFISHKIAGPMYRFEQSAEAIKEGDLKVHFRIRKNDEMKKIASTLEDMVEALRSDFEKIKITSNVLKGKINRVAKNLPEEDMQSLKKVTEDLDNLLSKYKT